MSDKNIYAAIHAVMQEVKYIQKEKKQGVKYAVKSEESVIEALRQPMLEHGIVMLPVELRNLEYSQFETVNQYEKTIGWHRTQMERVFRFYHVPSDTFIDVVAVGVGTDTGDKDANGAMTVAKKYAMLETFLIQTGDDPDDTQSTSGEKAKKQPDQRKPASQEVKELGYKQSDQTNKEWPIEFINEVLRQSTEIRNKPHAISWLNLVNPMKVEIIQELMAAYSEYRKSMTAEEAANKVQEINK